MTLAEGAEVRVTVHPAHEDVDPLEEVIGICETGLPDGAENHDEYLYGKLRDFTSMVVMQDLGITEVFSGGTHFRQVGLGFQLLP